MIEIDNEEVPILDGSGKIFVEKIKEAGVKISNQAIKVIKINNKVEFKEGKNKYQLNLVKLI